MEPMTGGGDSVSKTKSNWINEVFPVFNIVHGNQLIDLQYKLTLCIVGTMGLRNLTNIKSAEWFLIDFLSNVKLFYIMLLTVYET